MILCIDIGNTNISFLLSEIEDSLKNSNQIRFNFATDKSKTEDEIFFNLCSVLNYYKIDIGKISKIVASSVVPYLNFAFERMCIKYLNKKLITLSADDIPIKIMTNVN